MRNDLPIISLVEMDDGEESQKPSFAIDFVCLSLTLLVLQPLLRVLPAHRKVQVALPHPAGAPQLPAVATMDSRTSFYIVTSLKYTNKYIINLNMVL